MTEENDHLTQHGRGQAERLGRDWKDVRIDVLASTLQRAHRTALEIAKYHCDDILVHSTTSDEMIFTHKSMASVFLDIVPSRSIFRPRNLMVCLPLFGLATASAHHIFYSYHSGNSVDSATPSFSFYGRHVASQSVANTIGNALAFVSRSLFAAAIGQAFIQVLWYYLRHRKITIRHIDAMFASNGHPFVPASLPAWWPASGLSIISFCALSMTAITIFSPGALRIVPSSFAVPRSCNISTVDLKHANFGVATENSHGEWFYSSPLAPTTRFAYSILMTSSYMPPPSRCGVCQYDTKFFAPTLNCTNITDLFDFSTTLPTPPTNPVKAVMWNATYSFDTNGHDLQVASRNDILEPPKATACTAFNATYHVRIRHGNTSTTVDVLNTTLANRLITNITAHMRNVPINALVDAMALRLNGLVVWLYDDYDPTDDSVVVIYSPLGLNHSGYLDLDGDRDPIISLPSLMQNLSISLLSAPITVMGYTTLSSTQTTCLHSVLIYDYTQSRLLFTYGAGVLITIICIIIGFAAMRDNKTEESLSFSRLLHSVLNDRLFGKDISLDTRLHAERNPRGQLVPFPKVPLKSINPSFQ
jgi:Histidine phosphatase superfamily (branch 1)